jgi:hypothetical protein
MERQQPLVDTPPLLQPGDMPVPQERAPAVMAIPSQAEGTLRVAETLPMERRPATQRFRDPFPGEPRSMRHEAEMQFAPAPTAG